MRWPAALAASLALASACPGFASAARAAAPLRSASALRAAATLSTPLTGATAHTSIVGGAGVPIAEFPFQVALYDPHAGSMLGGFFCGGVIVDATHIATAAHCAIDEATGEVTPPGEIAVLAGTAHLNGTGEPPYGASAIEDPASATSLDPAYEPSINDYDVAVIRLKRPLWSGPTPALDGHSTIAPIAVSAELAGTYADPTPFGPPISATVSGWGDTRAESTTSHGLGGSYPSDLRAVQLPLVAPTTCGAVYGGSLSSQPITSRMLCAGDPAGGRDSCFGDSGGPLVVDRGAPADPPGDYVLAGLVSFGEGCAQPESPGVYASIANPQIASFLTSDPPQTPLGQAGSALGGAGSARPGGSARPTLTVTARECAHARCTVNVRASEPPGGAGVRTVRARLGYHRVALCLRRGRHVRCSHTVPRSASVRPMPSQHFLIIAEHLAPGSYTLALTAIDRAGLRQRQPTRVGLVVK